MTHPAQSSYRARQRGFVPVEKPEKTAAEPVLTSSRPLMVANDTMRLALEARRG